MSAPDGGCALVTGGSRGIGAAIAQRLREDGFNVATLSRNGADVQADVSDPDQVSAAFDEVRERFGPRVAELVGWVTKDGDRAAYLERLRDAPDAALAVKLADRLSNVQRLRTHPRPAKRASYYRETVATIVPLAAGRGWFEGWYRDWQEAHADLDSA